MLFQIEISDAPLPLKIQQVLDKYGKPPSILYEESEEELDISEYEDEDINEQRYSVRTQA